MRREIPPFLESDTPQNYYQGQERWLSSRQPELTRWAYIMTVQGFTRSTKIVAGEANGKIFDREEFVSALREGLRENPKAVVMLVFHKEDDKEKARLAFEQDNPQMMKLKRDFPDRTHFYWAPKRPRQHYAIVDDERVIFEQPNHPPRKPWWGHIVENTVIAREWEKRFDEYVGLCPEL